MLCSGSFNGQSSTLRLVAAEIVHHDQIAGVQSRSQKGFAESREANTVHGTVKNHRGARPIQSNRMHKRACLPATSRNSLNKSLTAERPATKPREVCLQPGFIEKYESFGIYARLAREPVGTFTGDVLSILLRRPLGFFLKRAFSRFSESHTVLIEQVRPNASLRSCRVASGWFRRCSSSAFSTLPVIDRLRPQLA